MAIRSHVQNSKFIIKRFKISTADGNVRVLDLNDWSIKSKGSMEIGTINNYFDEDAEQLLSNQYESPVGQLVDNIIKAEEAGTNYTVNANDIDNLKRFLMMLFLRKPSILDESYEKTTLAKMCGVKPTPSSFVNIIDQNIPNFVNRYLTSLHAVLIFNKNTSGRVFISSVKGFSVVGNLEKNNAEWWLPVSPLFGITFVDDKLYREVYQNQNTVEFTDEQMIDYFNRRIVDATIDDEGDFVFSNKDSELEETKKNQK